MTTQLCDLLDEAQLAHQVAAGYISKRQHPTTPLFIYNYTARAQYQRVWTPETHICRGLITDAAGTVIARGFDKFFNLNEMPETQLDALPHEPFEVTEKLDGSLGIVYPLDDGYAVATRGSFDGPQAHWATVFLHAQHDLAGLPPDVTLLVEIIYPDNRIVLDYGTREALVLLAARHPDGGELPYDEVRALARRYGFPTAVRYPITTVDDLLVHAAQVRNSEGWVVRFASGLRVKIKCEAYLHLHRAIFGLTPARVRDALLGDWESFIADIPEELRPDIETQAHTIMVTVETREAHLRARFATIQSHIGPHADRKAFALAVLAGDPADKPFLFALLDNKPIRPLLLKTVDLAALFPVQTALDTALAEAT